jgi:hypothetical protein
MSTELVSTLIAAAGFVLSIVFSAILVAFRAGRDENRLNRMEKDLTLMATKEQLSGVKEDLAEIKGMFRMQLKDGG